MSFAISGVNLELNHETCDRHEAGILRRSMHRKRGVPDSPRIVADAKETACTRVISSPYRITESAEILSRLNPLPNPALLGFQSVEIQASVPIQKFLSSLSVDVEGAAAEALDGRQDIVG